MTRPSEATARTVRCGSSHHQVGSNDHDCQSNGPGEPLAVFGDADGDGEIDLDDLDVLADCLTGPASAWENHTCCLFDAEADGDVDLEDFAAFQTTLTEGTQR